MSMRKLGRPTKERDAMLRNLVSELLWKNKLETTYPRAMEVRRVAEKLLTLAIGTFEDTVKVTKEVKTNLKKVKTKEGKLEETFTLKNVEFTNDGPKKLCARRRIMAYARDLQELKKPKETKAAYRARTEAINHPLIEKIFNELAPHYAARIKEKGQGGGYTRIVRQGVRRGDNAETVLIELV